MAGMGKLMKQAQEMQKKLGRVQDELGRLEVEGSAGGGVVKAVVNGKKDLISISINEEVVDPEDVRMLEDLVVAAVRQAAERASAEGSEKMKTVTGGLNLPGMGF